MKPGEIFAHQADTAQGAVLEALIVLAKRKRLILGMTAAVAAAMAIGLQFVTDLYTGVVKMLPPQMATSSMAGLLAQLGGLGSLAGNVLGSRTPGDLYVSLLRSRTLTEALADRFQLVKHYGVSSRDGAVFELSKATRINLMRDGIIIVEVDDKDPQMAADVANGYVTQLRVLNQQIAVTEASRRRIFFEGQLKGGREGLATAEQRLKETQLKTGLIRLDDQGRAMIDTIAKLRAQISAKEVQLQTMRGFATERHPEVILLERELRELRAQVARLEASSDQAGSNLLVPTGKIPEAALEYVRRVRDVKYYETMVELLAKQYEVAKLDEANDASIVQILDPAVPPKGKSKPRRIYLTVIAAASALLLAVILALILEAVQKSQQDPRNTERFRALRDALRWRP